MGGFGIYFFNKHHWNFQKPPKLPTWDISESVFCGTIPQGLGISLGCCLYVAPIKNSLHFLDAGSLWSFSNSQAGIQNPWNDRCLVHLGASCFLLVNVFALENCGCLFGLLGACWCECLVWMILKVNSWFLKALRKVFCFGCLTSLVLNLLGGLLPSSRWGFWQFCGLAIFDCLLFFLHPTQKPSLQTLDSTMTTSWGLVHFGMSSVGRLDPLYMRRAKLASKIPKSARPKIDQQIGGAKTVVPCRRVLVVAVCTVAIVSWYNSSVTVCDSMWQVIFIDFLWKKR